MPFKGLFDQFCMHSSRAKVQAVLTELLLEVEYACLNGRLFYKIQKEVSSG